MKSKIKICGLRRWEDIGIVNRYLPEYIGFVFAPSKRQVTSTQAQALKARLAPGIQAVGVFVNEEIQTIIQLVEAGTIDMIQLHGDESEDYIRLLQTQTACPVVKVVRVKDTISEMPDTIADYLLFDTYSDQGAGGLGISFDWKILEGVTKPYFLAGGLNPGNVKNAIECCHPYAVDVSSGVEQLGIKDEGKIADFIMAVRRTNEG